MLRVNTSFENPRWWQVLGSLPVAVTVLVAGNALYILLVAVGNITDYGTNFAFLQDRARALSSIGLLMIIALFFGGFIAVGGERFQM